MFSKIRDAQRAYAEEQRKHEEEKRRQDEAAATEAELHRQAAFAANRKAAVERAMARNISSGGAGMPYLVIDIVNAMATHGGANALPTPAIAMEEVKDSLWQQCRYLGGDAVLYCRFEIKDGVSYSHNSAAATFNAVMGVIDFASDLARSRPMGIRKSTVDQHPTVTVIGYGTVVKLLPSDQRVTPDDYAAWRPADTLPEIEIPSEFRAR